MKQRKAVENCYNKTAKKYAEQFYNELEGKALDRLLLTRFAQENEGPFADLGCGPGQTTVFLHKQGARPITGIDLSSEIIEEAKKLVAGSIPFEVGDMTQLNYPDNHFGAINASYAIVHFQPEELNVPFAEIYRVLNKGGQFMFSFHAGTEINAVEEFLDEPVAISFYYFDTDKVLEQLKAEGFQIKDALVRYPYEGAEYPSRRAYILAQK